MTQAVRYEGIFSATAMPDGLRRSARVAELAKKARISEVRVTESLRKRGRPAGKAKTSTVKASEPLQKPPARAPLAEKLRTRAVKAPEPSKSKPSDVEYQPLSKKGRGRRRATKEAPIQEVEASTQLTPKHPLQQPARPALNSDTLRHLEAEADPHQERARAPLSRDALQQLETETANNPFPEGIESVMIHSHFQ